MSKDDYKTIAAISEGVVKGVWGKSSETVAKKGKKVLDKIKVALDIAFKSYLEKSYTKYSTVKTLLYKEEPRKLHEFFVIPKLQKGSKGNEVIISAQDSRSVRNFAHRKFAVIQGTGGIGKSMLMKHLFLSELGIGDFIPVFFELKDINKQNDDYNLIDVIFESMNILVESTSKNAIVYALQRGMFMILLDGFDEIDGDKSKVFTEKLNDLCDKYPSNNVIMSSRPIDDFISFEKFAVLYTMPMDKKQAISLIDKLEYHDDSKQRFITALDNNLFEKHEEFASNPLLLTMMFLTYDEYAEIPETSHLFYERAFETLFVKHDSNKEGYIRKIESGLRSDLFKKIFATFCCMTYYNNMLSFSEGELVSTLNKVKTEVAKDGIDFDLEKYIRDLTNVVCMLYKEGYTYRFTHRSFQEYFTAVYLKDQTDDVMEKRSLAIIKKSPSVVNDKTFTMLYDMTKNKFERSILMPILHEIDDNSVVSNLYDFYFHRIVSTIYFLESGIQFISLSNIRFFVLFFDWPNRPPKYNDDTIKASDAVRQHLNDDGREKQYWFERGMGAHGDECFVGDDDTLYGLIRATWIGQRILTLSTMRETLTKQYDSLSDHDDFFSL